MQALYVCYDVTDDKRRTKLFKTLEGFGQHAQFSVFECYLDEKELLRLRAKVEEVIDTKEDSVLYVYLCAACHGRVEHLGVRKAPEVDADLIIV